MKGIGKLLTCCLVVMWSAIPVAMAAQSTGDKQFTTIEWTDLIPAEDLEILQNPPDYISEIEDGSVEDQISSQISSAMGAATDDRYQQALVSTRVKGEMDDALVRIPGFIVPLEFDEKQTITQFFLVPYFGACLHMPPPPPNQIILVDYKEGMQLEALYMPVWVSGKLSTSVTDNAVATSAYSMELMEYKPYAE